MMRYLCESLPSNEKGRQRSPKYNANKHALKNRSVVLLLKENNKNKKVNEPSNSRRST